MDTALQVDLAREEAIPQQRLNSPLYPHPPPQRVSVTQDDEAVSYDDATSHRPPKRSSRGAMITASQPRLKQKSLPHSQTGRSPSPALRKSDPFKETEKLVKLQPVDKGFGAWSYVAATFAMYIVVWGFPYSFPIFQTYLSTGDKAMYPDSIAIHLLAPGIQDILEGLMFPFLPSASKHHLTLVLTGICIITASLVAASYSTVAWQVVLTQGVLFGVGGILLNFVHVSIFSEWFDKQKGKAMGIIWTGWRVGALGFPLICQWLLDQHGYARTIMVLLPPMITLLAPAVVLLRGRYHGATSSARPAEPKISKLQALRTPTVLYYLLATNFYFLVVNVPKMFVTTFAADIGLTGSTQAAALVVLTSSEMLVTYLCGWLSDRHHHGYLMGPIALLTALAHIFGLGFARGKAGVFGYACMVGLLSGGYSNFLFAFYNEASRGSGSLFTAIHSLFSFFRGISILSVGPIGAELLRRAQPVDLAVYAVAKYQYLLLYAAIMSFSSGVLILAKTVWPHTWFKRQIQVLSGNVTRRNHRGL